MIWVLSLAVLAVAAALLGFGGLSESLADAAQIVFFALVGVIVLVLATGRPMIRRGRSKTKQDPYERGASADAPA